MGLEFAVVMVTIWFSCKPYLQIPTAQISRMTNLCHVSAFFFSIFNRDCFSAFCLHFYKHLIVAKTSKIVVAMEVSWKLIVEFDIICNNVRSEQTVTLSSFVLRSHTVQGGSGVVGIMILMDKG